MKKLDQIKQRIARANREKMSINEIYAILSACGLVYTSQQKAWFKSLLASGVLSIDPENDKVCIIDRTELEYDVV